MSFPPVCRTLRSGKNCEQRLHPKNSVDTENTVDVSETRGVDEIDGNINRLSFQLYGKIIRTNLEPLNEQISTLTQLLNQLVQDNWSQPSLTPHLVEKLEPLRLYQTRQLAVPDFCPTLFQKKNKIKCYDEQFCYQAKNLPRQFYTGLSLII